MTGSFEGRPVNVGLAGLGRFGKLHAAVLSRLPQARLAAICDPLAEVVRSVGDQYEVPGDTRSARICLSIRISTVCSS